MDTCIACQTAEVSAEDSRLKLVRSWTDERAPFENRREVYCCSVCGTSWQRDLDEKSMGNFQESWQILDEACPENYH